MENHDEEIERYLAQFQPRPVRALEMRPRTKSAWPPCLAAAAVVVLVFGVSIWYLREDTERAKALAIVRRAGPTPVSWQDGLNALALTKLALENDAQFEAFLENKSQSVLPSFKNGASTLRVLTKE